MLNIRPIHTEEDYQKALNRIEEIFDAKAGTDEGDELEVLGILVDDYEERRFPIDAPKPVDVIRFRLDQLGLTQSDLSRILGSRSRASEILSEQRSLSLNQIKVLSRELEIPADLLLEEPAPAVG